MSVIGQTFKDWRLLVHDDGSNDDTVGIIKRLEKMDSRICLIDDKITCGGAATNFMHLLKYSDADYVMFCDQDDLWFDMKVRVMLDAMMKENTNTPKVVYSNAYVWKPLEGIKGMATLTFPSDLNSFLFLNSGMQGCVAMFNAPVRSKMLQWKYDLAMHDHLLHLIGLTMGKVVYLPVSLMLYRNHEKNVTGDTNTKLANLDRLKHNKKIPVVDYKHYEVIKKFTEFFDKDISEHDKELLEVYLKLPQKALMNKMFDILKGGFKLYDSTALLMVKLLLRPYIKYSK